MAGLSSRTSIVAKRYAGAFIELADDSKLLDKSESDLADMLGMINASTDLQMMLRSPLISRSDKVEAMMAISKKAKFQDITKNFLSTLGDNGRLADLVSIIHAFQAEMRTKREEVEAHVQTAFALTPAQTKSLQEKIGKTMGAKVTLNVEVNKDLLGGLIVTVGSHMIDDSVRRKLERLELVMSKSSNQSHMPTMKEVG